MAFVALLLFIPVFLGGCAELVKSDAELLAGEVQALFDQKYIDPLTRYLEKHAEDSTRVENLVRVKNERDRRCGKIAERYGARSATSVNLDKLERGYRYSCPWVVDEFAARIAESGEPEVQELEVEGRAIEELEVEVEGREIEETYVEEPEVEGYMVVLPEAPETKPKLVAEVPPRVDTRAAENCYLLFGIKSYREALAACEPPARQGDARSQYILGIVSGTLGDYSAGLQWTELAVARDLPDAQLHLGLLYQRGQGVSRDDRKALHWFRRAGEQGMAEAQYRAALGYYRGEGAERDYGKALQWFGRAAEQGYAKAQAHLGEMYALGRGTEVDGERAESWLKRAAEQGTTNAQYRLGVLYAEGKIVPKDETAAYVWVSVAALAGDREAEALRDRLAQALAPARIEEAQHRIRRIVEQKR